MVLVTELTRSCRSTPDLLSTLELLQSRNVSLIAQTGMEFDLSTPFEKLVATFMAGLATFERDLCREITKINIVNISRANTLGEASNPKRTEKSSWRRVKSHCLSIYAWEI